MFKFIKRISCQNKAISLLDLNYRLCNGIRVKVAGSNGEYPFAQWLVIYFWRFNQDQEHHFFNVQPFTLGMMALFWHLSKEQEDENTYDCARVLGEMMMFYKINKNSFSKYDREHLENLLIKIEDL